LELTREIQALTGCRSRPNRYRSLPPLPPESLPPDADSSIIAIYPPYWFVEGLRLSMNANA
jgi:hypothetical protein